LADLVGFLLLRIRPRHSLEAENLFLRRQLALYVERGVKPRRIDVATRVSLALLAKLFDWSSALVVVRRSPTRSCATAAASTSLSTTAPRP
jgi:hypothetical protein